MKDLQGERGLMAESTEYEHDEGSEAPRRLISEVLHYFVFIDVYICLPWSQWASFKILSEVLFSTD